MEVAAGELFAIYGARGAGKTTLLEVAAGLVEPDSGSVRFDGQNLSELSRRDLARLHREQIGWVERDGPQAADVPMRVHVAIPLYRNLSHTAADQHATAMLERVGALDYADALWQDLPDTAKVIVAIAHALIRQPRLLVVDDPIYGLGTIEREAVIGLLRDTAENAGIAVLLAVPEMPALLHADQLRILANGKLIGPPPPDDTNTILQFPHTQTA